jgi:hypothetical protein
MIIELFVQLCKNSVDFSVFLVRIVNSFTMRKSILLVVINLVCAALLSCNLRWFLADVQFLCKKHCGFEVRELPQLLFHLPGPVLDHFQRRIRKGSAYRPYNAGRWIAFIGRTQ